MRRQCTAKARSGERCKRPAIPGGTVCRSHGGASPQVKALAAVRAELERWGLGDSTDDPGETLLRLLTQSRIRADMLAAELQRKADDLGMTVEQITVADSITLDHRGVEHKTGEQIRALVAAEGQERDRCARFAQIALAANLGERRARLSEHMAAVLSQLLAAAVDDPEAGLTAPQRSALVSSLHRHAEQCRVDSPEAPRQRV